MDSRVGNLARILVHYSLKIKPGQLFKISAEPVAEPLVKAVYEEALAAGAYPYAEISLIDLREMFYKKASDDQLKFISPLREFEIEKIDAYLAIWGSTNTKFLSGIDPARQQMSNKAGRRLMDRYFARIGDRSLNWCGTQFPTAAHAQDAEMSVAEYEDFVYRAGHVEEADPVAYWQKVEKEQERLIKILDQVETIHLLTDQTDLTLNVKGRKWINCCGQENFPDGEIFTSPIEDSANGTIRFNFPAFYIGREVTGVQLTFKNGVVVKASAEKDEDYLIKMLDTDEGSRRIGEFAIGTNYEITQFTKNTLFDEKIGGTCHMAVGASLPEAGGLNKSGIHWDMVRDLKKGGEIIADGKIIYKDGVFII
jgi:aminopeptidase